MTVLHLPDFTATNPYQSKLTEAIAAVGEPVTLGTKGPFHIVRSVRAHEDVSVVHFHWLHPYVISESNVTAVTTLVRLVMTVVQLCYLRVRGVSIVWTVHNVVAHESVYPGLERAFKRAFVRYGVCDRVFVHCDALRDEVIETYGLPWELKKDVVVVPHGHYIDAYDNDVHECDARADLGIGPSETVFLFFGQIRRYKGVFALVDAFTSVTDTDARLLIVGSPIDEAIAAELTDAIRADDRIEAALEFVPDDRIQWYMNAADVVVLPYRNIATSGSAMLAMSFAKAIVVPALGCVPELLDDQGAVMYDPEEQGALSDALREASERDVAAMGAHNYRLAERNDWRSIAERTVAVYRAVA